MVTPLIILKVKGVQKAFKRMIISSITKDIGNGVLPYNANGSIIGTSGDNWAIWRLYPASVATPGERHLLFPSYFTQIPKTIIWPTLIL